MSEVLLEVSDLCVSYGPIEAAHDVSFMVRPGEVLGLVGESGSGKSTVVNGLLRLLPPPAAVTGGRVYFRGRDLLAMSEAELRAFRWRDVAVVPQSALDALNPVLTMRAQFLDTLEAHGLEGPPAEARAVELMQAVGLDPVYLKSYPHELSGGMRQRVALALALAFRPPLLVMDEPTTALDVVVERQILRRVLELQAELGFAMIFITHDLSLLMQLATRIGVLYSGRLVELGPVQAFLDGGRHPYTQGLLSAIPPTVGEDREPTSIPGSPPSLRDPPSGCRFHPRCPVADAICRQEAPLPRPLADGHTAACHLL